ncbi:hypothetical protein [Pseudooceanicola spongiae]|uniref:Uncharacterized protein n=1 Tax=Pseudooceanicola spongiae TaxID=2613965 RepID=A0A7L9WQK5_9RHOB|nr:hypothetical protein [Pseudooceanicola spongiae]QOL82665.1 hypothetical protein F3W81_18675 [Pseudooceanicola spongiae]
MQNINSVAEKLCVDLKRHGTSKITRSTCLFTGAQSNTYGLAGSIGGLSYAVHLYEPDLKYGIFSNTAHFRAGINKFSFSNEEMDFWNADNRFTTMYRQDKNETFLVLDAFFPASLDQQYIESVTNVWQHSIVKELPSLKISFKRSWRSR